MGGWAAKLYPFRGYLNISGGQYEMYRAVQGEINLITGQIKDLPSEDGIYKVSGLLWKGTYTIKKATLIGDVAKEITIQEDRAAGRGLARTGAPGISGFQQRAEAATMALKNRRREAKRLTELLRSWA